MSIRLRHHVALSVCLSATVAALALHTSHRRQAAAKPDATATAETAQRARATGSAQLATTPAAAAKLPQYSDFGSPADRRRMMVDRLRALGVPNDVLALVASQDLEVEWDARFEACAGDSAKLSRVQLEKDMGRDAAMRAALGEASFKQWDTKYQLWEAMSTAVDVTPAEAESIYALKKKLQQRQLELDQAGMNGTLDRAQVLEGIRQSFDEYNRQLKAVMGEERYAKSQQLDDEFVGGNLRFELNKVNATDAQFQDLFKAEKAWSKSFADLDQSSPDYLQQYKALNEARDQEYEKVLGHDAYHHLRERQDSSYTQMKKYEDLWGLNDTKIDHVYDAMIQYRKAVGDYQIQVQQLQRQGQNVDWSVVNNTLQQLASQTQQNLQNAVGPESFTRLQRNGVLRWAGAGFRPIYGTSGPQ